ncbi:MAG TPA: hypothetical protein ENI87_12300, partial [bacterium]|nr:hypothetical protein [bacterium]
MAIVESRRLQAAGRGQGVMMITTSRFSLLASRFSRNANWVGAMFALLIVGSSAAQEGGLGGGSLPGGNLGGGGGAATAGTGGETVAFVYRDENGIPHIEAESEYDAWYALGYEQARDALLWIQIACKAARGELTWAIGDGGLTVDCAVKVFGTYDRLAAMTEQQRRTLLAPTDPNIQANFYDNCVAYASGVNAYRQAVKNAPPNVPSPELHLQEWLASNGLPGGQPDLAWVYNDWVTPLDTAAHGAMTSAGMSLVWPMALVNSAGGSYSTDDQGPAPELAPPGPLDPLDPAQA